MPIYEYRCSNGHTFEVMQRFSDGPATECEVCAAPVERVFHPIAVHFKGSGFYNTDYGTRKRSREMKESAGEGKGSGDSGSGAGAGAGSGSADSGSGGSSSGTDSGSTKAGSKASATE